MTRRRRDWSCRAAARIVNRRTLICMSVFSSFSLATLLLLALRLTGAIGWAWLWVLSPLWLPAAAATAVVAGWAVFALIGRWSA